MSPLRSKTSLSKYLFRLGLPLLPLLGACAVAFWLLSGRMPLPRGMLDAALFPVVAPMTGRVAEVMAPEGTPTRAGRPLIRLESDAYMRHESRARAHVAGLPRRAPTIEDAAERAAAAQAAEEHIVRRLAMVLHEEESNRRRMEEKTLEHARAALRMRTLNIQGASASARKDAQQAEAQARRRREEAKAAFEGASRGRAAVEAELARARREMAASRQSGPAPTASQGSSAALEDPAVIRAPRDGRVVGGVAPGQMVTRGETVLRLASAAEDGEIWVVLMADPAQAAALRIGQLCLARPTEMPGAVFLGEVRNLPAAPLPDAARIPVRIRLSDVPRDAAARLPGSPAEVTVWRRAVPGMRHLRPLLALLS